MLWALQMPGVMLHIPEGGGGFAPMEASPQPQVGFGSVANSPIRRAHTLGVFQQPGPLPMQVLAGVSDRACNGGLIAQQ